MIAGYGFGGRTRKKKQIFFLFVSASFSATHSTLPFFLFSSTRRLMNEAKVGPFCLEAISLSETRERRRRKKSSFGLNGMKRKEKKRKLKKHEDKALSEETQKCYFFLSRLH